MGDRRRDRIVPRIEAVERRDLLSGILAAMSDAVPNLGTSALIGRAAAVGQTANGFPSSVSSPLLGQGTPTPQELARERFVATFNGPIIVGPGRFSDQSKIVYLRGTGGSNQFRHGDYQMAIVFSTNPNAPLSGEAYLEDKNQNSAGQLALTLTGSPTSVDSQGRPTRLSFTNDPDIFSGIYSANVATGTVSIRYHGANARAVFQGLVYTSGVTNPLKNVPLVSQGGRISG